MADLLRAAMDRHGIADREMRAGIAAVAMGESALKPRTEDSYAGTSNRRIRTIFGARVAALDDGQLDALKRDEKAFFERVYGGAWGAAQLGNVSHGDGYLYRGRGLFQLTGRANYRRYGDLIGHDLIGDPELANDPEIAAEIAVVYLRDRYKGGGWEGIKRAVGNAVDGDREKDRRFAEYLASGEFAGAAPRDHSLTEALDDEIANAVKLAQTLLIRRGINPGPVDGVPGPRTRKALEDWQAAR